VDVNPRTHAVLRTTSSAARLSRMRWGAARTFLLALALGACGSDISAAAAPGRNDALKLLGGIAGSHGLSYANAVEAADFVAARKQLGVDGDADVIAIADEAPTSPPAAFVTYALPFVLSPFGEVAELKAFDGGKVRGTARTITFFGEPGTLVIATTQRPGEVTSRLADAGMKRRGGILTGAGPGDPSYFPYIAAADNGLFVLSDDHGVARAARGPSARRARGRAPNAAGILRRAHPRAPYAGMVARRRGCVRKFAVTQSVDPLSGAIELTGSIPKRRLGFTHVFRSYFEIAPTRKHGRHLVASFSSKRPHRYGAPLFSELLDKGSAVTFSCPGR
jgi:hypothetical protein